MTLTLLYVHYILQSETAIIEVICGDVKVRCVGQNKVISNKIISNQSEDLSQLKICLKAVGFLGPIRTVKMCLCSRNRQGSTRIQTHCGEKNCSVWQEQGVWVARQLICCALSPDELQ